MKKQLKNILIFLIVPIITGTISGIIVAKIQNINFIEALKIVLTSVISFVTKLLTLNIPVWVILIFIIILVILRIFKSIFFDNKIDVNLELKKIYKNYTEDSYNGIHYKWKWIETYDGQLLDDIHPICNCGCNLNYNSWNLDRYVTCPDCKKKYDTNNINENDAENVFINRCNKKTKEFVSNLKK